MLFAFTNLYGDSLRKNMQRSIYRNRTIIQVYDTDDFSLEDCSKAKITRAHNNGIAIENLKFVQNGSIRYFYETELPFKVLDLDRGVRIAFLGRYIAYQCGDWFHLGRYGNCITYTSKEAFALVSPPVIENGEFVTMLYTIKGGKYQFQEMRLIGDSDLVYQYRPNALSTLLRNIVMIKDEKEMYSYINSFSKIH